jgi:hypothetical protein
MRQAPTEILSLVYGTPRRIVVEKEDSVGID